MVGLLHRCVDTGVGISALSAAAEPSKPIATRRAEAHVSSPGYHTTLSFMPLGCRVAQL